MSKFKTYRVVRTIPGREHCIVITDDGSHFTAIGAILDQMKPGFIFEARTEIRAPRPAPHPKPDIAWLIELPSR